MKDDQRWRSAIHESAHIITAHELNVPIHGARIGRRSFALIAGPQEIDVTWQRNNDWRAGSVRAVINADLMICLGGPIGEKIHAGKESDNYGDALMIDALRYRFNISDERMRRLRRRTMNLLVDHWPDVVKPAERLADAGTLDRDEIEAILER